MRDPRTQYEQHRDVYDHISEQVQQTTSYFATASRAEQKALLNRAVSFALISTQTNVTLHEAGYLNALQASDFNELEQGLLDAGVNYYRSKAKYLFYNLTEPDYERVLDLYDDDKIDEMHRAIADEFKGVSIRKAAYAMAKVVTTDKCCVDTHIAQFMGLDDDEIYNGVVVEKYENQVQELYDMIPDELDHLSPFMKQWVCFDTQRETVTTHSSWFASLPEQTGVQPPGWS